MLTLGPLAFASPWILAALLSLPALWWLLRVLPPTPRRQRFPAIRFLLGLDADQETPAHTPLWLLILRLCLAAVIILALADPILNPDTPNRNRTQIVVVDDGWTVAARWPARQSALSTLIDEAERQDNEILILTTAKTALSESWQANPGFLIPADARGIAHTLEPKAWLPDRRRALDKLSGISQILTERGLSADVTWISDGLDYGAAQDFAEALTGLGQVTVMQEGPETTTYALKPPKATLEGLSVPLQRTPIGTTSTGRIRILAGKNRLLGYGSFTFGVGKDETSAEVALPIELRNEARRVEIENHASAGAVFLLDERWRRRLVGLVSSGSGQGDQPLLSDLYYLERALKPYAEIRTGSIQDLLKQNISVLVLTDIGQIVGAEKDAVRTWVEQGGTLLRFAGPRMAARNDDLIPVTLRQGGRALGGALSWAEPQKLSAFDEASLFYGLSIPDDITVSRQILAQPTSDLPQRTWARLTDGTPLVTAAERQEGRVILFHITANPDWSSLPLSGLYVEMLRRIVAMAAGVTQVDPQALTAEQGFEQTETPQNTGLFRPLSVLDGFGVLGPPPPTVSTIPANQAANAVSGPPHPPGFYGTDEAHFALNAINPDFLFTPLGALPPGVTKAAFINTPARALQPWLLSLALALILIDGVAALTLAGRLVFRPLSRQHAALLMISFVAFFSLLMGSHPLWAQNTQDEFALRATLETPLAYVLTGDNAVDEMSRAGLTGLSRVLRSRTAMVPATPMGVDIERDELAFFPLIYWPVVSPQATLSPDALAKVDAYMKNGGTILFDTQDHQSDLPVLPGASKGNAPLQSLLLVLDIPPLEPIPADHILTKAFYLLQDFPGRWSGGRVWVEAKSSANGTTDPSRNDGVSSLIIASNDYAAAWAEDEAGRPLAAVVPGGDRQREMAFRFGVNLVIYTLTGNYKADQVHVPALLERLGQ